MNYDLELKNILSSIDKNNKPNLFLHVCCAPCSSYVIKYLYEYFNIYIVFYNPNIDTKEEFLKRNAELEKLIKLLDYNIKILYSDYNHKEFLDVVKGYENCKEMGDRCKICFKLRLKFTYDLAIKYIESNNLTNSKNYFCSTLSVSPHKNPYILCEIANNLLNSDKLEYLINDFKKSNGYLESINMSKKYNIYRQDYCGCEFAKNSNFIQ